MRSDPHLPGFEVGPNFLLRKPQNRHEGSRPQDQKKKRNPVIGLLFKWPCDEQGCTSSFHITRTLLQYCWRYLHYRLFSNKSTNSNSQGRLSANRIVMMAMMSSRTSTTISISMTVSMVFAMLVPLLLTYTSI